MVRDSISVLVYFLGSFTDSAAICNSTDGTCSGSDESVLLQSSINIHNTLNAEDDEEPVFPESFHICDPLIVKETCELVNGDHKPPAKDPKAFVSAASIAAALSVNPMVMPKLLAKLAVPCQTNGDVSCSLLCNRIVMLIKQESVLPPRSDVACYRKLDGEIRCDLDVSPATLAHINFTISSGDMPKTRDKSISESGGDHLGMLGTRVRLQRMSSPSGQGKGKEHGSAEDSEKVSVEDSEKVAAPLVAYSSTWEMVERLANFFRIFPTRITGSGGGNLTQVDAAQASVCTEDIPRIAAKTKAWLSAVIRHIQDQKTRTHMTTWFGNTEPATRLEVLRISNTVQHMLTHVHYVFPGPQCRSGVYGYVHTHAGTCTNPVSEPCTKDQNGDYVIYLCTDKANGLYCSVSEGEKIETIVHEGSPHGIAFIDDVPPTNVFFGRSTCRSMALNHPEKAIKNADSFFYYIYDVASDISLNGGTEIPYYRTATAPAPPTPAPAAVGWTLLSGPCSVSDSHCIMSPHFPNNYAVNQQCEFQVVIPGAATVVEFNTERGYDKLNVNGEDLSGTKDQVESFFVGKIISGTVRWSSDGSQQARGFKLCPMGAVSSVTPVAPTLPPPEAGPIKFTVSNGPCSRDGDCVVSPNYPDAYGNSQTCEIATENSGEIIVEDFATEQGYDKLIVLGSELSGSKTTADAFFHGKAVSGDISWRADGSINGKGWKLCPKIAEETPAPTPAPTTAPTTPAPTPTPTTAPTTAPTAAPTVAPTTGGIDVTDSLSEAMLSLVDNDTFIDILLDTIHAQGAAPKTQKLHQDRTGYHGPRHRTIGGPLIGVRTDKKTKSFCIRVASTSALVLAFPFLLSLSL